MSSILGIFRGCLPHRSTAVHPEPKPEEECLICLDPMNGEDPVVAACQPKPRKKWFFFPAGPVPKAHSFHNKCIATWLSKENKCPACKEEISSRRIKQIRDSVPKPLLPPVQTVAAVSHDMFILLSNQYEQVCFDLLIQLDQNSGYNTRFENSNIVEKARLITELTVGLEIASRTNRQDLLERFAQNANERLLRYVYQEAQVSNYVSICSVIDGANRSVESADEVSESPDFSGLPVNQMSLPQIHSLSVLD
jgi:hypothetical protein